MTNPVTLREAELADVPLILSLIQQKYAFDAQLPSARAPLQATEQRLKDTLFGDIPYAAVTLAEVNAQTAGFALYYFGYSSFAARPNLWLDDLFVRSAQRQRGAGSALMHELVDLAAKRHCTHIGWFAHAMNHNAIRFYRKLGATIQEQKQHCLHFQLRIEQE